MSSQLAVLKAASEAGTVATRQAAAAVADLAAAHDAATLLDKRGDDPSPVVALDDLANPKYLECRVPAKSAPSIDVNIPLSTTPRRRPSLSIVACDSSSLFHVLVHAAQNFNNPLHGRCLLSPCVRVWTDAHDRHRRSPFVTRCQQYLCHAGVISGLRVWAHNLFNKRRNEVLCTLI